MVSIKMEQDDGIDWIIAADGEHVVKAPVEGGEQEDAALFFLWLEQQRPEATPRTA